MPSEFEKVKIGDADGTDDDKKRQKRGGKGMIKTKKKEDGPKKICLSRAPRGKKKSVTVVVGLNTFGKWIPIYLKQLVSSWIIFFLYMVKN